MQSCTSDFQLYEHLKKSIKYGSSLKERVNYLELKKGDYVYKPSEEPYVAFELVAGVIKTGAYSRDGNECTYDILKPGDFFGNLHYLDGNFQEYARCLSDVNLRLYDLAFYKRVVAEDHQISEWFRQYIVRRWCRCETRFFTVISEDLLTRFKRLHREFNQKVAACNGKSINVFSLLSQKDIADLIGASRQSVALILKKTEQQPEIVQMQMDTVKLV